MGTPNYMSPEQATGKPVNALTDVYSLGVIMYEMLTLQKPFQSHDIDKLLHQITTKVPKSPTELSPKIPEKLSYIVMKAMQKNPTSRYSNAAEMAIDLHKFLARDKRLKGKRMQNLREPSKQHSQSTEKSIVFWLSVFFFFVAIGAVIATMRR